MRKLPDDIRAMYDSRWIGAFHLSGKDVTLTIDRVEFAELRSTGNKVEKKPAVFFRETDKGLPLNKTNMKLLGGMYGYAHAAWIGKRITVYPTKAQFGGSTVDAVRIRPTIPRGPAQRQNLPKEEPEGDADAEMIRQQKQAAEAVRAEEDMP